MVKATEGGPEIAPVSDREVEEGEVLLEGVQSSVLVEVAAAEASEEEEVVSEPASPGDDPEDDERLWFKHPKAIRKAIRHELWHASQSAKTPPKGFSIWSRGSATRKKFPL